MIRRPPRSTPLYSSAASDVYKRQLQFLAAGSVVGCSCHVVFASSVQCISIYPIGYPVEDVTAWVGRRQVGWGCPVRKSGRLIEVNHDGIDTVVERYVRRIVGALEEVKHAAVLRHDLGAEAVDAPVA